MHKNSNTEIISRDLIEHINQEREKSDRSTIARLDYIVKANKQNYKFNLMTEKDSLSLSIIRMHIPQQSDIDKIVKSIESCLIHRLELLIQAQDLIKAYQTSTHFCDV